MEITKDEITAFRSYCFDIINDAIMKIEPYLEKNTTL